ncbi:MAG: nitrogen fixation protein NifX [Burkholderiales bacterium]|nr:nitrogen fixation protein NifX [Burkholderiales bacterium]
MRVKIAFASSDRRQVDQHFGAAEAFVVYELTPDEARLVEVIEFTDADTSMDGNENKLDGKIRLLEGCAAVYCNAVGASAVKRLLAAGIQPVKVEEGEPIEALLCGLKTSLEGEPPLWLARHLKHQQREATAERFATMAAEGWQE